MSLQFSFNIIIITKIIIIMNKFYLFAIYVVVQNKGFLCRARRRTLNNKFIEGHDEIC